MILIIKINKFTRQNPLKFKTNFRC